MCEDDQTGADKSARSALTPTRITAADLFGEHREITIDHQGQIYRLRITSNGKLILTK